jgi:murein DD-endopeptidase MepM/ murein hydrolase activator NlpD
MIFGKHSAALAAFFLCFVLVPVFSEEITHVLQKGETIYSVARSYGISASAVLELNGMTENDARLVQAGRRLLIPVPAFTGTPRIPDYPSKSEEYRVVKGDTLYSIARRYNISLQELQNLNGFLSSHIIKEGDRVRVPASGAAAATEGVKPAPATPARVDGSLRWPVRAKSLSYLTGKLYGVMVTGERAESVKSLTTGTVVSAGPYRGFGRVAIVQVSGGYLYVYGGCESLSVREGDKVAPGAELGKLGLDTKTEKPQLFFLVYRNSNPIDPAKAPRA